MNNGKIETGPAAGWLRKVPGVMSKDISELSRLLYVISMFGAKARAFQRPAKAPGFDRTHGAHPPRRIPGRSAYEGY